MKNIVENSKFFPQKPSDPRRLSKAWANDLLKYGISVLDKWWNSPNSHRNSVVYKILIISGFIGQLEREGYWWQAKTLSHHLHRYLAGLGSDPGGLQPKADTPPRGEEEASSIEVATS